MNGRSVLSTIRYVNNLRSYVVTIISIRSKKII